MVDGQEVNNYLASNFTVKAGKKISLNFNTNDYALDELKVNGKKIVDITVTVIIILLDLSELYVIKFSRISLANSRFASIISVC